MGSGQWAVGSNTKPFQAESGPPKNIDRMSKPKPRLPISDSLAVRWCCKFACALRGVAVGIRGQNSFYVHLPAAALVVGAAAWLGVSQADWIALLLCITIVLSAELFNTAIEHLARAITRDEHPEIRDALDVASAAVLVAAIGASVVGAVVFF